jgi:hypothetical protein
VSDSPRICYQQVCGFFVDSPDFILARERTQGYYLGGQVFPPGIVRVFLEINMNQDDTDRVQADQPTNSDVSQAARALGALGASKGGKARAEKLTAEQRREIAQKAIEARWEKVRSSQPDPQTKIPEEMCSGILSIAGIDLPCAVVENPTEPNHPYRLFSQEGFLKALGRAGKARGGQGASVVDGPPPFLAAKNLNPFIPKHLTGSTVPIVYKPQRSTRAFGFRAELLPEVCWVYLDALKAGVLDRYPSQVRIAENCELLVRGMATVGVIALVDEATGYQERRANQRLYSP